MLVERILINALPRYVRRGSLEVVTSKGRNLVFGDGTEPRVTIRFTDRRAERAFLWDPEVKLGELFMDGRLVVEHGSIFELLQLLLQDSHGERAYLPARVLQGIRELTRRVVEANTLGRAQRNVSHHYDLDDRLYRLFLDGDRQYSCAYFEHPDQSLEEAQLAKKRHLAAKLLIEPGSTVLDIGSGWGGLGLYLAEIAGAARVKGITLSREQLAMSRKRTAERGLDGVVDFALEDYRATTGVFDRIVSVGMFEHVGAPFYRAYFKRCSELLAEDGVMLLHTIGRTGVPEATNAFITRYIFPGGHLPTLSEIAPALEGSGLMLTDVEVLRLHYAFTLKAWRERFLAHRDEAAALYDERFCRMWECYLAMSEASFLYQDVVVFQIQLAKRNDIVPLTRDYVQEREAALRLAEQVASPVAQAAE